MHAYLPFWLAVDGMHPCAVPYRGDPTRDRAELRLRRFV